MGRLISLRFPFSVFTKKIRVYREAKQIDNLVLQLVQEKEADDVDKPGVN